MVQIRSLRGRFNNTRFQQHEQISDVELSSFSPCTEYGYIIHVSKPRLWPLEILVTDIFRMADGWCGSLERERRPHPVSFVTIYPIETDTLD
jgi:hypothetical protein